MSLFTEHIEYFDYMFYNCISLTSINLSYFNFEKAKSLSYMFFNCQSLNKIDLTEFNTEKLENMGSMFKNCGKLASIKISNLKTKIWGLWIICLKIVIL